MVHGLFDCQVEAPPAQSALVAGPEERSRGNQLMFTGGELAIYLGCHVELYS